MKILVAYDGSKSADAAIDDLQRAGLDENDTEVLILTVAEVWMPPPENVNGNGMSEDYPEIVKNWTEKRLKIARSAVYEAETLSRHAKERVLNKFPNWKVTAEATDGSPAWEILRRAEKFKADLIVCGSQGRNALGKILLGSVSQKILTEAKCSVRVSRGKTEVDLFPLRIMIGFDGSVGSQFAVEEVCKRNWRKDTEVCLVSAVQTLVPTAIGRFIPPVRDWTNEETRSEKLFMKKLAESFVKKLENAELKTNLKIIEGNPKEVICEEAFKWQADSIFVGAHSYSGTLEKLLLGSTSAAIAERANCSVEVVRHK